MTAQLAGYDLQKSKKNGAIKTMENNKYNLNRIERHYMIEVMLDFEWKYDREMTAEEFEKAIEKMRAKRARRTC